MVTGDYFLILWVNVYSGHKSSEFIQKMIFGRGGQKCSDVACKLKEQVRAVGEISK